MAHCPIQHAKAYPFDIPQSAYVLDRDGWRPIDSDVHQAGRHAVIASGSNASPARLLAKYENAPQLLDDTISVTRAQLHDFDAVYSAHIARYGAIPATLAHAPGAIADVFITWLTDAQLEHMHESEAVGVNYDYAKLTGIHLLCGHSGGMTQAHAYLSRRGCLNKDGKPIPLAATQTQRRQWSAMTQTEVLEYARAQIAPSEDTDTFIRQHIDCTDTRAARTQHLSENALSLGWSSVTVLR